MHYKLRTIANAQKRSENKEIEFVLEEYIKQYEKEHGIIPEEPMKENNK